MLYHCAHLLTTHFSFLNVLHYVTTINQIQILKIINSNNVLCSENKNGTFVNLTSMNEIAISKIESYLKYVEEQEVSHDDPGHFLEHPKPYSIFLFLFLIDYSLIHLDDDEWVWRCGFNP